MNLTLNDQEIEALKRVLNEASRLTCMSERRADLSLLQDRIDTARLAEAIFGEGAAER